MNIINISKFIESFITKRDRSLFADDLERYHAQLTDNIIGKSVMVIGGAGTIGSSFIKALLAFEPGRYM